MNNKKTMAKKIGEQGKAGSGHSGDIVNGLRSVRQKVLTGIHLVGYTLLLSHVSFIPYAHANPTGGVVVGGTGTITQSGVTTDIYQQSSSMAIDWSSYNLNSDEIVNYYQPGSDSLSLNRILSNDPSQINGQINANGTVILVNPNGLFFGGTSSVNVGGLIASGLDISPDDFMNGNYIFNEVLGTNGTVINTGLINAATGGNVTLLGKQVQNQGVISANLGAVNMAAGKQAVLTFDSQGLIGVSVTQDILQSELGIDPAVLNSGEINAQGGRILLTASQSQDVFSRAVNTGDLTQATSVVVNADGTFDLSNGADVVNSGTLNASATDANTDGGDIVLLGQNVTSSGTITANAQQGNGGNIELHAVDTTLLTQNSVTTARAETTGQGGIVKILGDKVGLFDQSKIDVSGFNGGGQALIGGDYQGQNSLIRNASRTYIGTNTQIIADALNSGDGGKIINWGNDYTWFYGSASAKGGANAGNGGFVEISGMGVSFDGAIDTSAANGELGTLLFDPWDIVICDQSEDCGTGEALDPAYSLTQVLESPTLYIYETTLEDGALPANANIQLIAYGDVTMRELTTDHELNLGIGSGSLTIEANSDNNGDGSFTMNASDTIITQGGDITISGISVSVGSIDTQGASVGASGGDVTLTTSPSTSGATTPAGDITVNGSINTSGGSGDVYTTGGAAGAIQLTSASSTATAMTVVGDLIADGGADVGNGVGSANTIDLQASNGTVILQGDISAMGSTNGDITLDAPSIVINDGNDSVDQSISGGTVNVGTIANPTQLNLLQSLTVTAAGTGADATITGNIDYNGIGLGSGTTPGLTVVAGNDVSITGSIGDSTVGGDQLVVTLTGDNDLDGTGGVSTGAITTQGGDVTIGAATSSVATNSIQTGIITTKGGAGQAGGVVKLTSTSGDIAVSDIDTQGGTAATTGLAGGKVTITAANGNIDVTTINSSGSNAAVTDVNGGTAGAIELGATGASVGIITVTGDLTANGGDGIGTGQGGDGGAITFGGVDTVAIPPVYSGTASSNEVVLQGDILALGGANGASAGTSSVNNNITVNTGTLTINGTSTAQTTSGNSTQTISGNTVNLTSALQLQQNLDVIAGVGADASVTGAINYNNIGTAGTLNINAGNGITLGAGIADSAPGGDLLAVTLTANTDGDLNGDVSVTGNIATSGGAYTASGVKYTDTNTAIETITTEGGLVQIDTTSAMLLGSINTKGGTNMDGGAVKLSSGATTGVGINVGAITTDGGAGKDASDVAMSGGNVTLATGASNIQVNGNINSKGGDVTTVTWGHGGAGGNVTLNSTGGDVYVAGTVDTSGSTALTGANKSYPGGAAGDIRIGAAGTITATGNLTANGGASSINTGTVGAGGVIAIGGADATNNPPVPSATTASSAVIIQGDVMSNGGTNGDITVNTQTLTINGGAVQNISGNTINLDSTNPIQLQQSLNITAGDFANATINGAIDYTGIGVGSLNVSAGDNVTMNGDIADLDAVIADQLAVTLRGNNGDGDAVGNVNVNGSINTGGGVFNAYGVNYDARSDAVNKYTITSGNSTIDMTGDVRLGEMNVTGTLDVITGGVNGISQGNVNVDDDDLIVSGISSFTSNSAGALITLGSIGNDLQSDISLTSTGTSYSDITLNNTSATTILGAIDVYGDLIVTADGNLTVNGSITGFDTDGASPGTTLSLAFAQDGVDGHTFDLAAAGSINSNSGTIDLAINGAAGADTFNLQSGAIDQNFNAAVIGGLAGADTFNLGININGTNDSVQGGAGDDTFNIVNSSISITDLQGGANDAAGDSLIVTDAGNNTWTIDGPNRGTLERTNPGTNLITFSQIENLTGGAGDDVFAFDVGGNISGTVDAGFGTDEVDYSAQSGITIYLSNATNGVINAETIRGGANSTLVGNDASNTWIITDVDEGDIGGLHFINFRNLTGGSLDDAFVFTAAGNPNGTNAGSISGIIDGAGGNDVANYSAQAGATVLLSGMQNIESVIGDGTSTLVAEDGVNTWQLYAPSNVFNDNTVTDNTSTNVNTTTVTFSGFSGLTGGSADDTFYVNESGAGTELIDGGGGAGSDTIDYSAITALSVDMNNVNFTAIENLIGNGSNSTLISDNGGDTWNITGNNSGDFSAGAITFSGFNRLQGGSGVDTFVVVSGGSIGDQVAPDTDLTSGIFGGDGDDVLDVTFAGAAGSLRFNGEAGADTVTLRGGGGATSGEYVSNANNGYDRLTYTTSGNVYSVNYTDSDSSLTVNDNVLATDFLVNGTLGNDVITILNAGYQVGARQRVNFSNKNNLSIDALTGFDNIDVNGNLNISGTLSLSSESVTHTSGGLSANTLTLSNVGTVGSATQSQLIDVTNLNIANASGDLYITDTAGGVNLSAVNNLAGVLDLTASAGDITDSAALVSGSTLRLTASGGNIRLNNANQLSGALDLTASGDVELTNILDTNLLAVTAGGLTVDTQGTLTQSGTLNINALTVANAQSVDLDNGTSALSINGLNTSGNTNIHAGSLTGVDNVVGQGDITLVSDNSAAIGSITSTRGVVNVTAANGSITSSASSTNITAGSVVLSATSGIGQAGNALNTSTSRLDVRTTTGTIEMANTGNIQVDMMRTGTGNITFTNNGTISADRIETDITSSTIDITTHDGSVLGAGATPAYTYAGADIAGYSVNIIANGGNLGTASRPLVIYAPGDISTVSTISFDTVYLPTTGRVGTFSETAYVNFSATDTLAALAGEQVTEVEDLDDVDPAIFTEVHNYNLAEISIKLPKDQLYENEQ